MPYAIYEAKDIGDLFREMVPTEDRANARVRELTELEHQRWEKIKKTQPDFPREALSYFSYRFVKT